MSGGERPLPGVGDLLAGKYKLLKPIGLGAMGLVFAADHVRLKQPVAIKFMQPRLVDNPEAVGRFEREARAASRLTNPHATRIFDVDLTPEGVPYLVSELLEGHDLRHELDRQRKLPVNVATSYIIQACAVMAEAHSLGIVHRDLKPSNLFLAVRGEGRIVKVLDFGVSKIQSAEVDTHDLTTTGTVIGSPHFMSPEQMQGRSVDARTDLWALGVVIFRALSGVYPFDAETAVALAVAIVLGKSRDLRALAPGIPEGLALAVDKALAKEPDARFRTARELAEALAPFAAPEAASLVEGIDRRAAPDLPSRPPAAAEIPIPIEVVAEPTIQATRGTWTTSAPVAQTPTVRSRGKVAVAAVAVAMVGALAVGSLFLTGRRGEAPRAAGAASAPAPVPPGPPPPPASASEPSVEDSVAAPAPSVSSRPVSSRATSKKRASPPAANPAPAPAPSPPPAPARNPNYL
jgi:eukaryotic-like serine/threonine-protein kinase